MARGRPPSGPNLVGGLDGPDEAKRRLRVILETVAGTRTIAEACAELGISEAAFHNLRKQALEAAVEGLAPRPAGRPRKDADPEQRRIRELEEQVFLLRKDLQAARIREEIAVAMPHLLKKAKQDKPGSVGAEKGTESGKDAAPGAHASHEDGAPQAGPAPMSDPATEAAHGTRRGYTRTIHRQERHHVNRMKAALSIAKAPPESERKYGPKWQKERREMERAVRIAAVAFRRWTGKHGMPRAEAAKELGIPDRTMGAWEAEWGRSRLRSAPRGRPADRSDSDLRDTIVVIFRLMGDYLGAPVLRRLFPEMPKREVEDMVRRLKAIHGRKRRLRLFTLRWLQPGTVWGMDFHEPSKRVDGIYPAILAVRDLATGQQLAWLPVRDMTAGEVVLALRTLFAVHGAPLLIKKDNGSSLNEKGLNAFLEKSGVIGLLSPIRTPSYNGSCEAGIGSMKTRTDYQASVHDRPGLWTSDDCETARLQANHTAVPRALRGRTPEEAWNSRQRIASDLRQRFQELIAFYREEERKARGYLPGVDLGPDVQAPIDRAAIRRALVACRLLDIRRRRFTLPISS